VWTYDKKGAQAGMAEVKKQKHLSPREHKMIARFTGDRRRAVREAKIEAERRRAGATVPSGGDRSDGREAHPRAVGRERILADDGSLPFVEIIGFSLRGFQSHQKSAADRFGRDWESALGALRSRGFEGGAGAMRTHADHLRRVAAQERIREVRKLAGHRFPILVLAVIIGYGPSRIADECGVAHNEVSRELREVLNRVAEFYDPSKSHRSRAEIRAERILSQFEHVEELISAADRDADMRNQP
jgi:hypothetical protein